MIRKSKFYENIFYLVLFLTFITMLKLRKLGREVNKFPKVNVNFQKKLIIFGLVS